MTSELGFQPSHSDSSGGQSVQKDVMRDCDEACTEVKENQDGE